MEAVISSPMAQSGTVITLVTAVLTIGGPFANASLYVGDLEVNVNEDQKLSLIHVLFKITHIK
jgi:polyadenylate-binding protein